MRNTRLAMLALLCLSTMPPALGAEGRTPVFAPATVITQPGKYVLTRNLTGNGAAPVVEIIAARVELDLNGFTIDANGNHAVLSQSNHVVVRNGDIAGADVGVELAGGQGGHAVIEDLRIFGPLTAAVRIVGAESAAVRRVLVNFSFGDGIVVEGAGITTQGRIESCQVYRGSGVGIGLTGVRGFLVTDNIVTMWGSEGIRIAATLGATVRENQVAGASGAGGIYLSNSRGLAVERNVVSQCASHGIVVAGSSSEARIVENLSWGNGGSPTMDGDGIRVEGLRAVILGNVLTDNDGFGLHLTGPAGYHTIGGNRARDNYNSGGALCGGTPALFPPNSCNDSGGDVTTFGDNLIPGPALF